MHGVGATAAAFVVALARVEPRQARCRRADQEPLRAGLVGPNTDTMGVPSGGGNLQRTGIAAHEQCRRASGARSGRRGRSSGANRAASPEARTTASARACSPGPHVTSDGRSVARVRGALRRRRNVPGGQRLFGQPAPGFTIANRRMPPAPGVGNAAAIGASSGASRGNRERAGSRSPARARPRGSCGPRARRRRARPSSV